MLIKLKVDDMCLESDEKANSDRTEATDFSSLSTDNDASSKLKSTDNNKHSQYYQDPKEPMSQLSNAYSLLAVQPNQNSTPPTNKYTPIPTSKSFMFKPVSEKQPPDISQNLPHNTRSPMKYNARTIHHKDEVSRQNIPHSALHISDSSASRRPAVSRGTSPITTISPQHQDHRSYYIPIPSPIPYYITRARLVHCMMVLHQAGHIVQHHQVQQHQVHHHLLLQDSLQKKI